MGGNDSDTALWNAQQKQKEADEKLKKQQKQQRQAAEKQRISGERATSAGGQIAQKKNTSLLGG